MPSKRPIGVFDSGIGGLSILKALRAELPHESFIYIADSGNAPYGEKGDAFVIERSRAITRTLINDYGVKAMVVACNTATAAAAKVLRDEFPKLPLVGVEPALKPAIRLSQTRKIGVIATRGTLESAKFAALKESLADQADFIIQPCDGLASAIEAQDTTKIIALLASYMPAIGQFGIENCNVDTLVLGCTHYPFISQLLRQYTGDAVHIIDTGEPVALHTKRILANLNQLTDETQTGRLQLLSTGPARHHTLLAHEWLNVPNQFEMITI
ncbi:MAG: glutamate racemase [Polaromonas sp.]|nr:glutamate racemase [Polaromonas sp.]